MSETALDLKSMSAAEKRQLLTRLLQQRQSERLYPMSYAQQRLWFVDQISPGSALFNEASAIRLSYPIDVPLLERVINEVVRRHGSLRTTFSLVDNVPVQIVHTSLPIAIHVVDLSEVSTGDGEHNALAMAKEEAERPFDLRTGPLLRITAYRIADNDYLLLLVMHHIVCDGYSMRILANEISAIYTAFAAGQPSQLPELEVQYTDVALWQRKWLQGPLLSEQLAYWRAQLDGAPSLDLPTDYSRPMVQSIAGDRVRLEIDGESQRALDVLAQSEGVTMFMVLLAIFKVLLHRYSGQDDLVVGVPIANRGHKNTEYLIGHFINTLALRTSVSGDPGFLEFLQRVRKTAIEAYQYQDVPFDRVVEELRPSRDLSRHPIFQVTFQYVHVDDPAQQSNARAVTDPIIRLDTAKFDIRCDLCNAVEGLTGYIEFNTALFDRSTIAGMARCFQRLVTAVTKNPRSRLSELPVMNDEEQYQVVSGWNRTARPYPRTASVHGLFEQVAGHSPDAPAISTAGRVVTYAELNRAANRVASMLVDRNVRRGDIVALHLRRSIEMVVAMLATLKAGAAYAPLDPDDPESRIKMLSEDLHPAAVLTSPGATGVFADPMVIDLDTCLAPGLADKPNIPSSAEDLAYVIYTSGSTGAAKGVMVDHRAIVRLVINTDYVSLSGCDRVAHAASCSFDAAIFEIWGALLNGACIVILQKEEVLSAERLAERLRQEDVTTLFLTTDLVHQLVEQKPDIFSSLSTLLFGGSAVDPRRIRRILDEGRPGRLLHVYGPTECTTFATWYRIDELPEQARTIPIGRPIANTIAFILDQSSAPVPAGIPGELYLGGDGLARGYLNHAELTAERFVEKQLPGIPPTRLYRTGDWARYQADGAIEFLGRRDRQTKVHGFRVELDEVERAISGSKLVRACAVTTKQFGVGDIRLIAYVVPAESGRESYLMEDLRIWTRKHLPDYMVPAHLVLVPNLPLNRNGKLDTAALPDPLDLRTVDPDAIALTDDLERTISGIWSEILGCSAVGVEENFFDLGGHSLLLIQVQARLKASVSPQVEIIDLFRYPTVRALARALRGKADGGGDRNDLASAPGAGETEHLIATGGTQS
jgi:amino acid adenylation domain-containing protein